MTLAQAKKYFDTIAVFTCDCSSCSSKNLSAIGQFSSANRRKDNVRTSGLIGQPLGFQEAGERGGGYSAGRISIGRSCCQVTDLTYSGAACASRRHALSLLGEAPRERESAPD